MEQIDQDWLREIHIRSLAVDLSWERSAGKTIKFFPGDRVRVVRVGDNRFLKHGWRGVVLDHAYAPWVAFDKMTHLGDPDNPFGIEGWQAEHMDCLSQDQLELISGN
jgi:hypothetical protein